MKSLKASGHELSQPLVQLQIIEQQERPLPLFESKLTDFGLMPFKATGLETLQINVGKVCNQTCSHCHVDAGPDREEIMSLETLESCLEAIDSSSIHTVDITGGAPEMNPHFRWFVEQVNALGRKILVRSNLTILTVNKAYRSLPEFFGKHGVTVISSLPCYTAENTDRQRGDGVFSRSIEALRMLNTHGYGDESSGLMLNLVYNPGGASLPPPQQVLERDYKRVLEKEFGVRFNHLLCITNMPISRFLNDLLESGRYEAYMEKLVQAFNPRAAANVMCRSMVSVGWDGTLYDCDFNQMLELKLNSGSPVHISQFDEKALKSRTIQLNQHCYGCTAGAGSSCGGEITA